MTVFVDERKKPSMDNGRMYFGQPAGVQSEWPLLLLALFALAVLTAAGIAARPIMPIDETRYIGVAWEMWLRGDFLVPFKNGAPYSHKPPLMMWLFQAGWAVFGVNDWWPRLVSPLVSAANLFLTMSLARRLWPGQEGIGGRAALILVSCLLWLALSTMAMFDIILALFTLIGVLGIVRAAEGNPRSGPLLMAVGIGLGILAKGPVILLHLLPLAILAPWWQPGLRWGRWYGGVLLAVLLGALIALAWAIPAGIAGGEDYRNAIFWGQTADRMVESFAHRQPFWWYLPHLPLMFFPWFLWPNLWCSLGRFVRWELDRGGRFCLAWMLPVIVAFSFVSGKQMHYLIPVFPAFALFAARSLTDGQNERRGFFLPVLLVLLAGIGLLVAGTIRFEAIPPNDMPAIWPAIALVAMVLAVYFLGRRLASRVLPLAVLGISTTALVQLSALLPRYADYDLRPMAEAIHQLQRAGYTVANDGTYHNQYQFVGRLQFPLVEIETTEELKRWLAAHPNEYAVVYAKDINRFPAEIKTVLTQPYRGQAAALLDARSALLFLEKQVKREIHNEQEEPGS